MLRRLLSILLTSLIAIAALAQDQPAPEVQHPPTAFSRIRGLFDIDLPELDPPGTFTLIFRPHVSDFVRRDYLRTEAGFRWTLNDNFEFSTEAATYVTHGFGAPVGYGIGELDFGSKYIFRNWPQRDYETSASLNVLIPSGRPPLDMTDGHNHYSPGIVIQHHAERNPRLTTFAGTSVDLLASSTTPGVFQPNQPKNDSISVTAGGVYEIGQIKWTLTGTYTTTALISGTSTHFFYLQPSLLWYVPKKLTLNSKTQWIVGFGTPMTWGPDGYEFKVTTRLRAEITFRQVMDNMRQRVFR
jgi:hypothetical protein